MIWGPSAIRRILRRRAVWWVFAAACALLGGVELNGRIESLEAERAAWGDTESVVVVTAPVAVGEEVASSAELRLFPGAMVPASALRSVPTAGVAKADLHPGEILLGSRVTGESEGALPEGTSAMTLQLFGRAPLVRVGDLVDIWVVDSANQSSERVAARLVVLERSDADITVAVPADQVAAAAVAALRPVTAVLVG